MSFKINHEDTGFKILPEGDYEVYPYVVDKTVAKSSGNKMVQFNYIVRDDVDQEGKGQEIKFDNFVQTPTAQWRVNQASLAAGIPDGMEFDDIYDWADEFLGKAVVVSVGHREWNGRKFPEVRMFKPSLYGGEYTPPKTDGVAPADGDSIDIKDDDLPF